MAHILTARDLKRLEGLKPAIRNVVIRAAEITEVPFMVVEGVRSREGCMINYGKGRTAAQLKVKGIPASYAKPTAAKVTWLNDPFASKHCDGEAVDLLPAPYDWKDTKPFDLVNKAMMQAAKELKVNLRWGADWDRDGKPREKGESDSPHWEI